MFHVDVTTEDTRIIATTVKGTMYEVSFHDLMTGKRDRVVITDKQLICVLAVTMHSDELSPQCGTYKTALAVQNIVTNVRFMP